MTFKDVLTQIIDWLQQDGRVSYLALKRQFDLDDDYLADLKEALAFSHPQACDEEGKGLVWTGEPLPPLPDTHPETDRETWYQSSRPNSYRFETGSPETAVVPTERIAGWHRHWLPHDLDARNQLLSRDEIRPHNLTKSAAGMGGFQLEH